MEPLKEVNGKLPYMLKLCKCGKWPAWFCDKTWGKVWTGCTKEDKEK